MVFPYNFPRSMITRFALAISGVAIALWLLVLLFDGGSQEASAGALLGLGFLLGLRHAFDGDHLVAVGTLVGRRDVAAAARTGALWGAGHTSALLVAGVGVLLLKVQISEQVAHLLEFGVGVMITGLGASLLWRLMRARAAAAGSEASAPTPRPSKRPFWVGLIHGMAGSAGLMLLVLAEIPSPQLGIIYILVFGIGSIAGMAAVSIALTLPYQALHRRYVHAERALHAATGLFGVGFGLHLMYQIGIVERLFL